MRSLFFILSLIGLSTFSSCDYDPGKDCPSAYHPECSPIEELIPKSKTTKVHVLGAYESHSDHCFQYHPQGEIDVHVNTLDKDYILVLTSYEPIKWNLIFKTDQIEDNLRGVILTGFHCQELDEIKRDVPIVHRSFHAGSQEYYFMYDSCDYRYPNFETMVNTLTGAEVSTFQGEYQRTSFSVE